jgi:hypothetical protein
MAIHCVFCAEADIEEGDDATAVVIGQPGTCVTGAFASLQRGPRAVTSAQACVTCTSRTPATYLPSQANMADPPHTLLSRSKSQNHHSILGSVSYVRLHADDEGRVDGGE